MWRSIILRLMAALMLTAVVSGDGHGAETKTIIDEVVKRQSELELALPNYTCEFDMAMSGEKNKVGKALVKRHGDAVLVDVTVTSHKYDRMIACCTKDYMFSVTLNPATKSWVLREYVTTNHHSLFRERLGKFSAAVFPLSVFRPAFTLSDVYGRGGLEVTARSETATGNRLQYTLKTPHIDNYSGEGSVLLNSNFSVLSCQESGWTSQTQYSSSSVTANYARDTQGELPKEILHILQYDSKGDKKKSDMKFHDKYQFRPVKDVSDPAEFTIQHYKIQPPTSDVYEDRPGFNWPLWGGIGVGCIALSVFLAWFIRRKRRTS